VALQGKQYVRIIVEFAHDVALGVFPGAVIGAWLIRRAVEAEGLGAAAVARASGKLWILFVVGLAVSIGTGVIRLKYWRLNVRTGALEDKKQMATIKHSLFVLLLLASAAALYAVQAP